MEALLPPGAQPYSPNHLFGLIFTVTALLFLAMRLRTGVKYFSWLSAGTLFSAVAWATTDWQNPGLPYVDWGWWWAQPVFSLALVCMSVGLLQYLPISAKARRILVMCVTGLPLAYVLVVTLLLVSGVQMIRLWAVLGQTPAVFLSAAAAFHASRIERRMGHGLICAALLAMPVITMVVVASGSTTTVVRFWTGLPLVCIVLIILAMALLQERKRLQDEVLMRIEAEKLIQVSNASLERKVRERTADLQEVVSGLETFNRNISHDLRGPLGSIDMLAYMADQFAARGDTEGAREQLAQIKRLVRSSHDTVDALLSLARTMELGVHKGQADLSAIAETAMREVLLSLGKTLGAPGVPAIYIRPLGRAVVDVRLLRLALVNLLGNALKFNLDNPTCEITVGRDDSLSTLRSHAGRETVSEPCLFVKDTGVGFDPGTKDDAFKPFGRMSSADRAVGHGIGLSIVRRIIERHDGRVWIESSPGRGTTVFFTLGQQDDGQPAERRE